MGDFAEVSGWLGAVAVLAGYLLFSFGWITSGRLFHGFNLLGAATLIVNGYCHGAWPSVATNFAWGAISGISLLRTRKAKPAVSPPEKTSCPTESSLIHDPQPGEHPPPKSGRVAGPTPLSATPADGSAESASWRDLTRRVLPSSAGPTPAVQHDAAGQSGPR